MKSFHMDIYGIKWHVKEVSADHPEVKVYPESVNEAGEYLGHDAAMNSQVSEILILETNNEDRKRLSLLHEVIEIISYDNNLDLSETQIKCLTAGINSAFKIKPKEWHEPTKQNCRP